MQSFASLLAIAAAATAYVLPRQDTQQFNLTGFYFGGERFGISDFYHFTVTDPVCGASTYCTYSLNTFPDLATWNYTACTDPTWSFAFLYINWTTPGPGYSLQITRTVPALPAGTNETACMFYPASDVVETTDSDPNANYKYLNVSEAFSLDWQANDGKCIYA